MGERYEPLKDYLTKLIIPKTKGNDEIRVYQIRDYVRRRIKGSLSIFSGKTGTKYKNVLNWFGNSSLDVGVPISELIRISDILDINRKDLFRRIKWLGGTNTKKYFLPKQLTPKLAYLLGYIMGDGHLANPADIILNGSRYNAEIRITTCEKHHLEFLQNIFGELFGYRPPLFKENNFYRLVGRSKVIHRFFDKVCGVPTGNKRDKTLIPKIMLKNKILCGYFLSGFFDADGCAIVSKGRIASIRIKQHNRRILEQCVDVLKKAGIRRVGIYEDNGIRNGIVTTGYVLAIQNREGIERFMKMFFSIKIRDKVVGLMNEDMIPKHIAIIPDGIKRFND
jgi:intein/homing endonuclease